MSRYLLSKVDDEIWLKVSSRWAGLWPTATKSHQTLPRSNWALTVHFLYWCCGLEQRLNFFSCRSEFQSLHYRSQMELSCQALIVILAYLLTVFKMSTQFLCSNSIVFKIKHSPLKADCSWLFFHFIPFTLTELDLIGLPHCLKEMFLALQDFVLIISAHMICSLKTSFLHGKPHWRFKQSRLTLFLTWKRSTFFWC